MFGSELVTVAVRVVAFTVALSQQGFELLAKAARAFRSPEISERELMVTFQQVSRSHHLIEVTGQGFFRNREETRQRRRRVGFSHSFAAQPEKKLQDFVAPENVVLFLHSQMLN